MVFITMTNKKPTLIILTLLYPTWGPTQCTKAQAKHKFWKLRTVFRTSLFHKTDQYIRDYKFRYKLYAHADH